LIRGVERLFLSVVLALTVVRMLLGTRIGFAGASRTRKGQLGRCPVVVAIGFFEQRIFLQHPLDLGVQLDRRQLQQPDRLLQLRASA
jgi:hypothetical protein